MNNLTAAMEYDLRGVMTRLTYPGGRVVDFARDGLGRLDVISESGSMIADYAYLGAKHVESRTQGNNTKLAYAYDGLGRVVETVHDKLGEEFDWRVYAWDNAHNKVQRAQLTPDGSAVLRSTDYSYDGLNRMAQSSFIVGADPPVVTNYSLDASGNRAAVNGAAYGAPTQLHEYSTVPGEANARVHDLNGNWVGDGGITLAIGYDVDNLMTQYAFNDGVNPVVNKAFGYDSSNRRVWEDSDNNGAPDRFFLHYGDRLLEEYTASGALVSSYVYGNYVDEVIQRQDASAAYYFHADDQWNTVALTNASGNVVEQYLYDDFGTPTVLDGAGSHPLFVRRGRRRRPRSLTPCPNRAA